MAEHADNETLDAPENTDAEGADVEAGDVAAEAVETAANAAPAQDAPEKTDATAAPERDAAESTHTAAPTEDVPEISDAAAAQERATPAAPAARAREPVEELSPKERRRRARSLHVGQARPARSPQERHAERLIERRAKAARRRARRLQERAKAANRPEVGQLAPRHAPAAGVRRVRQGIVVSDKAEKTITVRIDVARRHPRYEKIVRSSSTLHAHDENNDAHEGDVVRVVESRPLSRTKRWKLLDVLERAR